VSRSAEAFALQRPLWIPLCCVMLIACDKKAPSPPVVEVPAVSETVNGSERIGWDQPAADVPELATIAYVMYVDGTRTELAGVTCASTAAAAGFACTARLPAMPLGAHTLELASFVNDGGILESPRSAALRVTRVAQTASVATPPQLRGALALGADLIADGLESPTDLAFAPDGRMFVAERGGRIRIVPPSALGSAKQSALLTSGRQPRVLDDPAIVLADTLGTDGQLLALAIDPQFLRTHYVFAIYTAASRRGEIVFTVARFREVSDTLGDRLVILDGVPAARTPSAALRFGPDGKLYAAFDDGDDQRRRLDAASFNGKVLRLNSDGTTPADSAGSTPVYVGGYGSPIAIDWDRATGTLWVADGAAAASPFAFYRGALLPDWDGRLVSAETLFDRAGTADIGPIAIGPDGAIYYGTARAIGRAAPVRAP
jgi:hypothetical protein